MRRLYAAAIALALGSSACGTASSSRTVLVDYKHDQFATAFFQFFPRRIEAHPGDTVVFRQAWSGEPHSVTMGRIVDTYGRLVKPYLKIFAEKGYEGLPDETPAKIAKIEDGLPWMSDDDGNITQNGAQPCFLLRGLPPKDKKRPCTDAQQREPEFDGRYNYFNSGFIPYAGPNGDTYSLKLAEDVKPGEHFFYCNYHGPFMSGFIDIKPKGAEIASQGDAATQANVEIQKISVELQRAYRDVRHGRYPTPDELGSLKDRYSREAGGRSYLNVMRAGIFAEKHIDTAMINEFAPRRVRAKVGEELTWLFNGGHTLSFNVPKYFPIIRTAKDGTLSLNPKIKPPFGGAPDVSKLGEQDHDPNRTPGPREVDGGAWNGRGFWSTGLVESYDVPVVYRLRVTRPGTYRFACLVHPPMVGTLTVTR